jgi:hypothetical protein
MYELVCERTMQGETTTAHDVSHNLGGRWEYARAMLDLLAKEGKLKHDPPTPGGDRRQGTIRYWSLEAAIKVSEAKKENGGTDQT